MPESDRFEIVVPLHEVAGWRRALAVDRGGVAPRAVVLSYPPPAVADDPDRLLTLIRDTEAAARVLHPHVVPSFGLETAGEAMVVVEAHRRGATLRALLAAGRVLEPELAVRAAVDACAALAAIHGVDAGDGEPLVHGGVSLDRLLLADDGSTLLTGLGTAGGGTPAGDVRALAAALHECLSGEAPARPARPLAAPAVPPALAEVVGRALGAVPGGAYTSAEAFRDALSAALAPAPAEVMAAHLESVLPAGEGERGEVLRLVARALSRPASPAAPAPEAAPDAAPVRVEAEEVGEVEAPGGAASPAPAPEQITAAHTPAPVIPAVVIPAAAPPAASAVVAAAVGPAVPATSEEPAQPVAAIAPVVSAAPIADAAQVAPAAPSASAMPIAAAVPAAPAAPAPAAPVVASVPAPAPVAPAPAAAVAVSAPARRWSLPLVVALVMAVLGFGGGFLASWLRSPAPPGPGNTPAAAPQAAPAPAPASPAAGAVAATPAPVPAPVQPPPPAAEAPQRAERAASIAVTAEPPGDVYVNGKRVGRSPLTVPLTRGDHEVRLRNAAEGVDVRRRVNVRGPGTPVRFALGRGALDVSAPPEAEIFVDGRRVGKGKVRVELWEGRHRVEARLGVAKVQETFEVGRNETWTYAVTPTP